MSTIRGWGKFFTGVNSLEHSADIAVIDFKKHLALMIGGRGWCLDIFVVCILFLFLSRIRHDYKVIWCFSHSVIVSEWPLMMLVLWDIVYLPQEKILVKLCHISSQLTAIKTSLLLFIKTFQMGQMRVVVSKLEHKSLDF